jgi:uncharacterized protein (TIGR02147 family)
MNAPIPLNIFNFIDYRKFLQEYYLHMKKTTSFFSHRYFMRKAGICSPNFLKNVMEGKKNLTKDSVVKFAKAIGFGKRETDYFENLVFFNQSATYDKKQYFYDRMKLFSQSIVRRIVSEGQAGYFSKWYHCIVRELIVIKDYQDNWEAAAKDVLPRITPSEARESVLLLLRLNLVTKNSDGTYRLASRNITSGDNAVGKMLIRQVHKDSLRNAAAAIDNVPADQRSCTSLVMSVTTDTYKEIEEEIKEFRNRVTIIANKSKGSDRVYQLCVQLFPASASLKKESRQ